MTDQSVLTPDHKSPLEMFYHWESLCPDEAFLKQPTDDGWEVYSWRRAGDEVRSMARALLASGLVPGDRVGIFAANSARWVLADIAIMMAGLVSVPIYPSMPEAKVRYVQQHSGFKALFADNISSMNVAQLRGAFADHAQVIALDDTVSAPTWGQLVAANQAHQLGSPVPDTTSLWTVIYTSGTTGNPKGVMHNHLTVSLTSAQMPEYGGTERGSRFFSFLPLAHLAERGTVELHALYCGGSISFNSGREKFIQELCDVRPDFFLAVPRIWTNLKASLLKDLGEARWQSIAENPAAHREEGKAILASLGLENVKFAFSGAASISPDDIRTWQTLGLPLFEGYGQTEVLGCTINRHGACKVGSVGKTYYRGSEIRLSGEGEILVRSPAQMLGYYNEPEKTAETLVDGWIHTGDKGVIDDEGFVTITGRVKEIFKTAKGKYVAPAPIEGRFSQHPYIEQLCLVGSGLPQTLLLVVPSALALNTDRQQVEEELHALLTSVNATLEVHEKVGNLLLCAAPWSIENEMLTPTLKIRRDALESHYTTRIQEVADGANVLVWE